MSATVKAPQGRRSATPGTAVFEPISQSVSKTVVTPDCRVIGHVSGYPVRTKPLSRRPTDVADEELASGHRKGGPCDPTTSANVGGNPTSQLFPRDYSQLYPCCQAVRRVFWQVSRKTWRRGDTPIPALPAQQKKVHRRQRQGAHLGAAFLLQESLEAARPNLGRSGLSQKTQETAGGAEPGRSNWSDRSD